jgi:hypothetical protein
MSAFDEPLGVISTAYLVKGFGCRQSRHDRQLSSKAVVYYPRVLGRLYLPVTAISNWSASVADHRQSRFGKALSLDLDL